MCFSTRTLIATGVIALMGTSATAADYSDQFDALGIAGTITRLTTIENPTPSDRFALGGALFLRGIETTFQERYRMGLHQLDIEIPGLLTDLHINPTPEPFTPDAIASLFTAIGAHMDQAQAAMAPITGTDQVAVTLDLDRVWFDINANGARDDNEDLFPVMASLFASPRELQATLDVIAAEGAPTITFDTADVAWLQAYTHVFAGTAEMVMAFDQTDVIGKVQTNLKTIDTLRGDAPARMWLSPDQENIADLITIVLGALEQDPNPAHTRAALRDFQAVIAHNLVFWDRVRAETDNTREFIPNASQDSAVGLLFPPNIDRAWQAVLHDAGQVLSGELLIPHWRTGDQVGINLNAWLTDPAPLDVIGVLAGSDLAPYMARGPVATRQSISEFNQITGGNFALFAFMLN